MEPALFEEFAREYIAEVNRSRSEASSAKAALQHDVERVNRQIKRLVDVILDGADAQAINAKLKELEAEKSRLALALEASPQEEPLLHPHLATIYRARVDALETLSVTLTRAGAAFDLLRGLIDEVRIVPEEEAYQFELKGELAEILALAQGAKNSEGSSTQKALQIKMVAGVGFEPTTFRL